MKKKKDFVGLIVKHFSQYRKSKLSLLFLLFCVFSVAQNTKTIKGTVVSTTGEPLVGVTVQQVGTNNGALTDVNGMFTLNVPINSMLRISYVGYITKELKVSSAANLSKIILKDDNKLLDEVVVIGYGVQKKKLVTGATVQVKGEDIEKLNTVNPLAALQSKTPGVSITQSSGMPGEGFKVNIRGLGTIGDATPLYIIDGITGGDINSLNPADIESIDVLKDAASAAIYGSRAANGVILVTTKQGKAGKTQLSYDGYVGIQNVYRMPNLLNAKEYAMFESFRVNIAHSTGIIQWMLNSAWPSLYWQLYDYYGVPTASYYSVKAGNMPQQLIYNYADHSVYAVNESLDPVSVKADMELFNLKSNLIQKDSLSLTIQPGESSKVFTLKNFNDIAFLSLKLNDNSKHLIAENFYCLTAKNDTYDYPKSTWYMSPITEPADYKPLASMPSATIEMTAKRMFSRVTVQLKNTSDKIAFFNELVLKNTQGHAEGFAKWSENYMTLLPGETKSLECTLPAERNGLSVVLRGWNTKEQEVKL